MLKKICIILLCSLAAFGAEAKKKTMRIPTTFGVKENTSIYHGSIRLCRIPPGPVLK